MVKHTPNYTAVSSACFSIAVLAVTLQQFGFTTAAGWFYLKIIVLAFSLQCVYWFMYGFLTELVRQLRRG